MLLEIEQVLNADELSFARQRYSVADFGDGRMTAGELAASVKNNRQLPADSVIANQLTSLLNLALQRNNRFFSAALPRSVCTPLFNRYVKNMGFGTHIDNAIRIDETALRADISCTLFLSDPEDYDGGELVIEDTYGTQKVKLSAGNLILYPSTSLHRVNAITRGQRDVIVFWIQSMVRDTAQRRLLFELDQSIQSLRKQIPDSPEIISLAGTYHNLLRLWADI